MTNLNNTIAGTIAGANNMNNKGENTMNNTVNTTRAAVRVNRGQSGFAAIARNIAEERAMDVYSMFKGYRNNASLMMPQKVCFDNIEDVVKFLSNNYAIADATGTITEGVNRVLNATSMEELAKAIRDCGKEGSKNKTGQRYVDYGTLVKSVKVVPRLGGGTMTIKSCSRFEVQEFFKRTTNLDIAACNEEDLAAIKADMQIIGRVLQEIAIDIAKDKSLDAGVDLKKVFTYIPVLSRLVRKSDNGLVDNTKSIVSMIEDAIAKNPVVNTGVKVDSIPDYVVTMEKFEQEYIRDWASVVQTKSAEAMQDFFNGEVMDVIKTAGVTKEDLEIQQLGINNGACVDEIVKIMDLYFTKYVRSLDEMTDHKDDEMNDRVTRARRAADKEVKAAFRDTLYAIGRAYGLEDALTRKLVYAATMTKGIHRANITKAMSVLGEDDMLLMWSNEEGIAVEAVNVEIAESFEDLFDAGVVTEMEVTFVDDVATNEFGEEVAYGYGMTALNGAGTIVAEGNEFKFIPAKKTEVAPIGTKRVAFLNKFNRGGIMTSFAENGDKTITEAEEALLESLLLNANNAFFIPQAKTGDERAVGVLVEGKPMILGTTIKVGDAYVQDMFIEYKQVAGEMVQANNKKHKVEQVINTKYGMLLVLSC